MSDVSIGLMRRIDRACEAFEQDGRGGPIAIDDQLNLVPPSERCALIWELIPLDLELRQRRGDSLEIADYQRWIDKSDLDLSDEDVGRWIDACTSDSGVVPTSQRYRFIEPIGSGGNGDVWRVEDRIGGRTLAVKRLRDSHSHDESAKARLTREALLTGRLQHPGIPPIYDHGELDDGAPFFSMKLVAGATFESMLKSRSSGDDDLTTILGVFEQVTQTVAYAHSQNVIHRDLKPQNVMVGAFGEVQVMDWGMAKSLSETLPQETRSINADESPTVLPQQPMSLHDTTPASDDASWGDESWEELSKSLTMAGDILGTPAYMSPEQSRGLGKTLDARSDVFTLGAILFEILTQTRLHQGCSVGEAVRRSAMGDFEDAKTRLNVCDLDDDLIAICRKCLQNQPSDRFDDAGELSDQITRHIASVERRARQATIEQRESAVKSSEDQKRRRLQTRAALVVALVSVVGGVVALWQRGRAVDANANTANALLLADRRLDQAQSVVDELLSKVADDNGVLTRTSGAQALRRDLLDKAVDYYESFLSESEQDPELRLKVAKAHLRLGQTYLILAPGGDEVVRHATKTINLCDELMKEAPDDPTHLECKAKAYGLMSRSSREANQNDEAFKTGQVAQNLMQQLVQQRGSTDDRFMHAYYLGQLGMIQHWRRKHNESDPLLREAIRIASPIQVANPGNAKYLLQLSGMHSNLGVSHGWGRGEWPQCLTEFENAVRLCTAAVGLEPDRSDYRSALALREMNLAMALTHAGRLEEAEQTFRASIANHERLVRDNPLAVESRVALANACANFSTFCFRNLKRSDFAVESIQKAVAERRLLRESNPDIKTYVDLYTGSLLEEAVFRVHSNESKDRESMAAVAGPPIDLAIECWRIWCETHPDSIDLQKKWISWMAIRLDTDSSKLVSLVQQFDDNVQQRKMQDDAWIDTRVLAFLRNDQNQQAGELLNAQNTNKPSRQRMLIQSIALAESDPLSAQSYFEQAMVGFKPDTTPELAELLLFKEAEAILRP